ncbi:uncharacterized protein Dwil_GK23294 [Drosophila willistoni]|uniref:Uncharacterized protein n=1 Tax=Drosophila willistoni TaxID=7260 RepID=B4NNC7_DROWI|nr:uncharacterized protein Dwil_GK23294 [Drosophila willistoni]
MNSSLKNDQHLTEDETLDQGFNLYDMQKKVKRDVLLKYYESYDEVVPLEVLKSGGSLEPSNGHQEQTPILKIPDDSNCVNLKSLVIWHSEIIQSNMSEMITNTSKLENLDLRHCNLSDDTLVDLKSKKNLKSLSLAVNEKLSGSSLMKLPASIQSLNLQSCYEILSNNSNTEAWKALSNLKVLNIKCIRNVYPDIYNHLTSIESLTFSLYENVPYKTIAKLPNLKHIEIAGVNTTILEKLLDQLVKYKSQQLEHLHICNGDGMNNQMLMKIVKLSELQKFFIFNAEALKYNILTKFTTLKKLEHFTLCHCQHVTNAAMMRLVLGCPKLRVLDLQLCFNVSEKLVLSVIHSVARLVMYKKNNREFPIHIYGDFFTEESIRSHRNLATSNIIQICHSERKNDEDLTMYIDFDE